MAVNAAALKADVVKVLDTIKTVLADVAPFESYFPAPVKAVLVDAQAVLNVVEQFLDA